MAFEVQVRGRHDAAAVLQRRVRDALAVAERDSPWSLEWRALAERSHGGPGDLGGILRELRHPQRVCAERAGGYGEEGPSRDRGVCHRPLSCLGTRALREDVGRARRRRYLVGMEPEVLGRVVAVLVYLAAGPASAAGPCRGAVVFPALVKSV